MEAKMSQSSSGAPGWQLEGNAPLAYDTHIVDVFLQDYSRRLVEVAAIKPGQRRFPLQPLRPHNARTRARARATVAGTALPENMCSFWDLPVLTHRRLRIRGS